MNSATSDPLINHLRLLTEHLGHALPEADLFRVFKGKPDAYAVEDAVSALEVAGYRVDFGKARLLKLDPILFAVLAFDAEGSPFVVLEREDKDRFPVIDASTGSSELQILRRQDQRPRKARGVLRATRSRRSEEDRSAPQGHWFWAAFSDLSGVYGRRGNQRTWTGDLSVHDGFL